MQYNARAFNFIPIVFPRERTVACFLKLQRHSALPLLHVAIKRVAIAPASIPQSTATGGTQAMCVSGTSYAVQHGPE